MSEFQVSIPDEHYDLLNFKTDDLPGIAVVNSVLKSFEPKEIFAWHLSVILDLTDVVGNGMPSETEVNIIDAFGDELDDLIKGTDKGKPNALFLARVTWNGTRELLWRVYNPELANSTLQILIDKNQYPREFEFTMNHDEPWHLAEWHLTDWEQ